MDSGRTGFWTTLVFTCGLVLTLERCFTIEWALPLCSTQGDGPMPAVFGAPFPYERWAGVSLEYVFMPHVYLFNVVLLCAMALPLVRRLAALAGRRWPRQTYRCLGACGLLLCLGVLWRHAHVLGSLWSPVASITLPGYGSWLGFRPIRITTLRHYDCSPSPLLEFWFGPNEAAR